MKLYDLLMITDGNDVADKDWDFYNFMALSEEPIDNYDRFLEYLAKNVEVIRAGKDVVVCDFSSFLWSKKEGWKKFTNEENREGYRFDDYEELSPNEDTGFYEVFMETLGSLLNGNYSDSDYGKLLSYIQ